MDLTQIEDVGSLGTGADFLHFLCGLMFFPLAFSARCLGRSLHPALPWSLLSWFAAASTAVHWMFLLLLSQDAAVIHTKYLHCLEILPWVLLLEFARRAANPIGQKEGAKILWMVLLLVVCVGTVITVDAGHAFLMGCGLVSSLFGGVTFWNAGRHAKTDSSRRHFHAAGVAVGLLGLTGVFGVLFPMTALVLETVLAGILALAIFQEHQAWQGLRLDGLEHSIGLRGHRSAMIMMGAILIAGFVATTLIGMKQDRDLRDAIQRRAALAASTINADNVRRLEWNTNDESSRDYLEIKRLMMAMVKVNPDLRFASLVGVKQGKCFILVDSEPPDSKDYSPPGDPYPEADPLYIRLIEGRQPFTEGPVPDRWGIYVTGGAHVADTGQGDIVSIALDIDARNWNTSLAQARLPMILITLLVVGLAAFLFLGNERARVSAARIVLSEKLNRNLVEGSPNCVQMFDRHGCITAANSNGILSLGLPQDEIIGRRYAEIWPESERPAVEKAVQQVLQGQRTRFEATYIRPDGRSIVWYAALNPMMDANGQVCQFVGISVDITEHSRSRQALREAKEAAEAAARAKSDFLSVMSHEIRTPLSGVIGLLNVLLKQRQPPDQRHYTELARDSAETLLGILSGILDSSKVEAGKLILEKVPFRPRRVLTNALGALRPNAENKGLQYFYSFSPEVPQALIGDPMRLTQIVVNLVNNAIKFTEQGSVTVTIDLASPLPAGEPALLRISVSDTGVGISPEAQARLFNKFEQADVSTTRKFGGTGLGLSIAKNLVGLMGGHLTVESQPGVGTTFRVQVPLPVGGVDELLENSTATARQPMHSHRLHLLCAEDNFVNRTVINLILEDMGHEVEFVEDGQKAVDALSRRRFDAVLMDNRMPVMDGFEATRVIRDRTSSVLDHDVFIIAATANSSREYEQEALRSGMNDWITKPVREDALHAALQRAIEFQAQRGVAMVVSDKIADASLPPAPAMDDFDFHGGISEEDLSALLKSVASAPGNPAPDSSLDDTSIDIPADLPPPSARDYAATLSPEARKLVAREFLRDTPERLSTMKASLQDGDSEALGRSAHTIKSTSLYVNAPRLSELGLRMESLADAHDLGGVEPLLIEAESEFASVRARLESELVATTQ